MSGVFACRLIGEEVSASMAGGKGAALDRLVALAAPVPPSGVVTTESYRAFAAQPTIATFLEALVKAPVPPPPEHEAARAQADEVFLSVPLPPAVAEAVDALVAEVAGDRRVAVRSSATAEDLSAASFAGQYESYLNVEPADAHDAVRRVWASLWYPSPRSYRWFRGIAENDLAMAVVVMQMLDPSIAGVLFTRDPGGRPDAMRLEVVEGLGEQLVSGAVTPDAHVVDRGEIVASFAAIAAPLADLAREAIRLEDALGVPQDIEFAVHHDQLFLVQARPITTSNDDSANRDDGFDFSCGIETTYTTAGVTEMLPGVLPPLLWGVDSWLVENGFRSLFEMLGGGAETLAHGHALIGRFGGRAALNLDAMRQAAASIPGGSPEELEQQYFGPVTRSDEDQPPRRPSARACGREPSATGPACAAGAPARGGGFRARDPDGEPNRGHRTRRRRARRRRTVGVLEPAAPRRTAGRCGRDRGGSHGVGQLPQPGGVPRPLHGRRRGERSGAGIDRDRRRATSGTSCARRRVGGRATEDRSSAPRRSGRGLGPDTCDGSNRASAARPSSSSCCRRGDAPARRACSPARRGRKSRSWRGWSCTRSSFGRTNPSARPVGRTSASNSSDASPRTQGGARPAWRRCRCSTSVAGSSAARRAKRPSSSPAASSPRRRICNSAGSSGAATWSSADASSRADASRTPTRLPSSASTRWRSLREDGGPTLHELSRRRRSGVEASQSPALPLVWTGLPPAASADDVVGERFEGWSASPGRYEGLARVVRSPEATEFRRGEVLVATTTDASWTPLFIAAGAIVVEQGGPLSHAAIVARELGLPTVVNVPGFIARLEREGGTCPVVVDGTAGVVTLQTADEAPQPLADAPPSPRRHSIGARRPAPALRPPMPRHASPTLAGTTRHRR